MKKLSTFSIIVCLVISSAVQSCKKKEDPTPVTPTPVTPTTPSATAPTPSVGSVDGVMVSLLTDINTTTAGYNVQVATESGLAMFYTTPGGSTFADAGTVSVNTYGLEKQTNNTYFKTASVGLTPSDLNFDTNDSKWEAGGAGSIAAFSFNHSVAFPKFTGTIPESVSRASGLSITLSGKVTGADSVIVVIAKGSISLTRTFAGSAGTATISAADLSAFPVVADKTAILEIVPYKVTSQTLSGKTYAFIKEYAAVRYVNMD